MYTDADYTAFYASWLSIAFYVFAMLPQLWKNYRLKSVDGLSFGFLFTWLLGDTSNMLGAILTDQYPNVKATSIYFLFSDVVILLQYAYYSRGFHLRLRKTNRHSEDGDDSYGDDEEVGGDEFGEKTPLIDGDSNNRQSYRSLLVKPALTALCITLVQNFEYADAVSPFHPEQQAPLCNFSRKLPPLAVQFGYGMAWLSGLLYFSSRIPQILTNYRQKSVRGLSVMLFVLTVAANLSYGVAIITRLPELNEQFYKSTLPYLIGSLGTLLFDLIILGQSFYYGK